jgi:hypothetical protein
MRIPGPSSTIIAASAASFADSELTDLPGVIAASTSLTEVLTDTAWGSFSPNSTIRLDSPRRTEFYRALERASSTTEDTLLLYYSGHGMISRKGEFVLATADTEREREGHSAVEYGDIRDILSQSRAMTKVVILDCCFSGRAFSTMSSPGVFEDLTPIGGAFVITSSAGNALSMMGEDKLPAFTKALTAVLLEGTPQREPALSLQETYLLVRQRLVALGLPDPQFSSSGDPANFGLVLNRQWKEGPQSAQAMLRHESRQDAAPDTSGRHRLASWFVPGFANDSPLRRDMLKIHNDAVAVGALLSSTSLEPPLAIGIYGEWGSGKTFFMRHMDAQVRFLGRRQPEAFSSTIVSVWFNAWHYAEGNLWASLLHSIISSLKAVKSAPEQLMEDAVLRLATAQHVLDEAKSAVDAAERNLSESESSLATLQATLNSAIEEAGKIRLRDVGQLVLEDETVRKTASEVAKKLGVDAVITSVADTEAAIGQVRAVASRARFLATGGPFWRTPLFLGAAALVATYIAGVMLMTLLTSPAAWVREAVVDASRLAAVAAAVTAWATRQTSVWRAAMKPAEKLEAVIRRRTEEEKGKRAEEIAKLQERIDDLRAATAAAQLRLQTSEAAKFEAEEFVGRLRGAGMLEHCLNHILDEDRYEPYLGLIALTHKDLRTLCEFLQESGQVKRVILYIDDLDRCSPSVVTKVLEAVHLLLALPSFVVVLGVDPRWLVRSVKEANPAMVADTSSAPTAGDYLDKIIQIGYRLPEMNVDSCVDLLEYTLVNTQARWEGPGGNLAFREDDAGGELNDHRDQELSPGRQESSQRVEEQDASEANWVAPKLLAAALELGPGEIALLRNVAPLVGATPRRAKRFLNVYRLAKARAAMDDILWAKLEGGGAEALMTLIALMIGLPVTCIRMYPRDTAPAGTVRNWIADASSARLAPESERIRAEMFLEIEGPDWSWVEVTPWSGILNAFAWPLVDEYCLPELQGNVIG